jgi:membrane protein
VAGALQDCLTDRVSLAAAGSAFYGTLALFPAISVLISTYGLVFDPAGVEPQLHLLAGLVPAPAFMLIEDRVHELIHQPPTSLSVGLVVSSLLVFWSAATGSKALLSAVNVAYDVPEKRSFVHFQTLGLVMTLAAVVSAVLTLGVLLVLRPVLSVFGVTGHGIGLIRIASQVMVVLTFAASIALLYRFGPSRPPPPRPRLWIGTLSATLLWLAASEALSIYISNIGSFGATYGSIGAVVGIMLWFYVSAYAVLLGAELNASLEAFEAGN